jgi:hypothetical protein
MLRNILCNFGVFEIVAFVVTSTNFGVASIDWRINLIIVDLNKCFVSVIFDFLRMVLMTHKNHPNNHGGLLLLTITQHWYIYIYIYIYLPHTT